MSETRPDLVRGLLQSCYVIEVARANVQQRWGGDFDRDATNTRQRADRLAELLAEHGIPEPDGVIEGHTDWFEFLCGSRPDEIPLGAAALYNFGKWANVYAGPYLGDDAEEFVRIGREHTRVDLEVRTMTTDEALLPVPELPAGRRFVVLTDIHVGAPGRSELLRRAVDDINEIGPEFVVIPGDITEDGEPEQFAEAREILDGLACPYHAVLGNHDGVRRSTREPQGDELFAAAFGGPPTDHVLECGDLQVALVDTTDPTPSPFPEWNIYRATPGEGLGAGVDSGALRPGQAEALAARLDPTRPTLLVQHHELHPFPGFPPVKFALREEDATAELNALSGHHLVGIVAGHTHRSAVLRVGDGSVTQLEIPSLKDWPFAYSVVGVGEGGGQVSMSDEQVRVVVRQVSDRDAVWSRSKDMLPLTRRFMISPISDLSHAFEL